MSVHQIKLNSKTNEVTKFCISKIFLYYRGYNILPENPVNIIDFHGLHDRTIPFSVDGPGDIGEGPDGTVMSYDGFYYHQKMMHLTDILNR